MLRRPVLTLLLSAMFGVSLLLGNPEPCAAHRRGNYVVINPDPHPERNTFSIQGPAVIGFFPTVTKEQMEDPYADGLDTLVYLLFALERVEGCLRAIEPELRIVLNDQLKFHWDGTKTTVELSDEPGRKCGAYLLKPESGWRVVYLSADPDSFGRLLSETAAEYFGVPECSAEFRPHRSGIQRLDDVCGEPREDKTPSTKFMPKEKVQKMWDGFPYDEITLERSACSVWCPAYRITLHRGGQAEWYGFLSAKRNGDFDGEVWMTDYAKLCYLLKRLQFDRLPRNYAQIGTSSSSCIVTAVSGKSAKVVSDYGKSGPKELSSIEQAIDAVAESIKWKKK